MTRKLRKGKLKMVDTETGKKEAQEQLVRELMAVKKVIENIKDSSIIFKKALEGMNAKYKCLQFQLILQDLESTIGHIDSLETDGPKTPHDEISLEDSEIPEEEDEGVK